MNAAFGRGKAIVRLEHYADVIVLHLTLLTCFPESQDVSHSQKEIKAFQGTIRRYDNAKGSRKHNFKKEDIIESLLEVIETGEGRDYIASDIMGRKKGLAIDVHDIAWDKVRESIAEFAKNVLAPK